LAGSKYRSLYKKEDKISHLNPKTPYSRSKKKVSAFHPMKEALKPIMQVEGMRRTSNLCVINKPRITSIEVLSPSALVRVSLNRHQPRRAVLGSGAPSDTASSWGSDSNRDEAPDGSEGKSMCGALTKTILQNHKPDEIVCLF
jgi:hypothetical protein